MGNAAPDYSAPDLVAVTKGVLNVLRPHMFFSSGENHQAPGMDVAILVLSDPITNLTTTRLVSPMELAQLSLLQNGRGVESTTVGFGPQVYLGPMSATATSAAGRLDGFHSAPISGQEKFYNHFGAATAGPGDSGSPVVIPGPYGGFAFPVSGGYRNPVFGFSPIGWLDMTNEALSLVGSALIPRPTGVPKFKTRKKSTVFSWIASPDDEQWVNRYAVLDQNLEPWCTSAANRCVTRRTPAPGDIAFVKALNTEGESSTSKVAVMAEPRQLLPPAPAPNFSAEEPFVRFRLLGPATATGVTRYQMQDKECQTVSGPIKK